VNTDCNDSLCCSSPHVPFVPLPMMVFGMMMAFMFGMMMGRKSHMMMHAGHGPMMLHGGMRGHHHHGEGPACRESHDEWSAAHTPPMEP